MNNSILSILLRIAITAAFTKFQVLTLTAQSFENTKIQNENDSLSLEQIIGIVIQNHPKIGEAKAKVNRAASSTDLARTGYYPEADASLNVSHVGPVPSLTIPDYGSFQLFPENNFNAGLNIRQNIYDFGKTASNVSYASKEQDILESSLKITKQELSTNVIKNFFTLAYLQQAVKIKEEQLTTLGEHLDYIKKKKATGSATNYEILSTEVRISLVEGQKLDLEAAREVQLSILNSLIGMPAGTFHVVKENLNISFPEISGDSMISYAIQHREELKLALKNVDLAALHYIVVKSQNNPSLDFFANGGWKNGYIPDLNQIKANYVVGLGVRVPVFDGTKMRNNLSIAKSSMEISSLEKENILRNISSEVIGNETVMQTAFKKVSQSVLQLKQADEAYKLADLNYSIGAITNLDLLDAASTVSESRLMLLKSRTDYVISACLLQISLGNRLY